MLSFIDIRNLQGFKADAKLYSCVVRVPSVAHAKGSC